MLPGIAVVPRKAGVSPAVHPASPLPFTAGDWHSVPERVRAVQRGACASLAGCIGLIGNFSNFLAPGVIVKVIRHDGLPTLGDVDMPHGLLSWLVDFRQCLQGRAALRLGLQCDA